MEKNFFFLNGVAYVYYSQVENYCEKIPFDPPIRYPELPFITKIDEENRIYPMVRELLQKLDMDKEHAGTPHWSPFKDIIKPGDKVLIKPNLVTHYHYLGRKAILSTIVHGSIIRPIVDYVYKALDGEGNIVISDIPVETADFNKIMSVTKIQNMVDALNENGYQNLRVMDFRPKIAYEGINGEKQRIESPGDSLGYALVDLGKNSCFAELNSNSHIHYYTLADRTVDHLDPKENKKSVTDDYHNSKTHKYIISKTVLDSDIIINVAKLKTHCKAGVSVALKNMIGIVSTKDCMPHHRPGPPSDGDAFPDYPAPYYTTSRKIYRNLRWMLHIHRFPGVKSVINILRKSKILVGQHIEHGNWKGNDTIWRTILDINRIALYADKNGVMQDEPQRKLFCLIDGIIGQHGDAPISGEPIKTGIILGGYNPVVLDAFAVKVMGIDYKPIKTISKAPNINKWPLLTEDVDLSFSDIETPNLEFKLPKGWE